MGETFLDRHGIKSGIKLNDVIEEYRYVANGQTVKKGDFLTYEGEDVAPAIEPPFNAVALSSGVGAPEYVEGEVTKTGNMFEKTWTRVSATEYTASDGTILTASSSDETALGSTLCRLDYICDNDTANVWRTESGLSHWVKLKLPEAKKITKMKTQIYANANFTNAVIQGSNNDSDWIDLYTVSSRQDALTEITLSNVDYYQYYRIVINQTASFSYVHEWQTSEYIELGQIPSTEHNQQVKIARVYKEVEAIKEGNIISTSWTKVNDNEYVGETGDKLKFVSESDGIYLSKPSEKGLNLMCDGDRTTSTNISIMQKGGYTTGTFYIEYYPAKPINMQKIRVFNNLTTASSYVNSSTFEGSNDGLIWEKLCDISHEGEGDDVLNNSKEWGIYRFNFNVTFPTMSGSSQAANFYDFRTLEYISTEVIQ